MRLDGAPPGARKTHPATASKYDAIPPRTQGFHAGCLAFGCVRIRIAERGHPIGACHCFLGRAVHHRAPKSAGFQGQWWKIICFRASPASHHCPPKARWAFSVQWHTPTLFAAHTRLFCSVVHKSTRHRSLDAPSCLSLSPGRAKMSMGRGGGLVYPTSDQGGGLSQFESRLMLKQDGNRRTHYPRNASPAQADRS